MILYNNVFSGGKTQDNIVKITHDELIALAIAENLDTSVVYQITDYEAINGWAEGLTQKFSNNGKRFDILIKADSTKTISVNCGATQHDGDNSFEEMNLSQWKLTYIPHTTAEIIQNSAYLNMLVQPINAENSKGSILLMTDQNNNCVNFDFKTILINGRPLFGYRGKEISEWDGFTHDNTYIVDFSLVKDTDGTYNYQIMNAQNNTIIASLVRYLGGNQLEGTYLINNRIVNGSYISIYNSEAKLVFAEIIASKNIEIHNDNTLGINGVDLKIINCNNLVVKGMYEYTKIQHISDQTINIEAHPNQSVIYTSTNDKINVIP